MEMKIFLYLRDDNEGDDGIKALVDSGTDRLIEIDDTLADENYALDKICFFLFLIHVKVYEGLIKMSKCDTI